MDARGDAGEQGEVDHVGFIGLGGRTRPVSVQLAKVMAASTASVLFMLLPSMGKVGLAQGAPPRGGAPPMVSFGIGQDAGFARFGARFGSDSSPHIAQLIHVYPLDT